jgi:GntR family galactonate operon transcriptional repressor
VASLNLRGLHAQVVNLLGERILRGEIQPGEIIDPDELATSLEVSRTVVREAIKVLTAKGLVDARPKHGTFVVERSMWKLLDSDVMAWRTLGDPDPRLVVELGEVRQIIEPSAARMAAERRTAEQLIEIEKSLRELEHTPDSDRSLSIAADLAFHRAVLAASGNELLERFEVVLEPALYARDKLAFRHHNSSHDFWIEHAAVYDAIVAQDADGAYEAMRVLMDRAARDTAAIL